MKKILLSVGVITVFIAYSLVLRHQNSGSVGQSLSPESGSSSSGTNSASYKNGTYTGNVANAFYGNVQVQASASGGKITNVQFLQYPNENPNSQNINHQAMPLLRQEAIRAQSAHVDIISGATQTSQAFIQSLSNALSQAQS